MTSNLYLIFDTVAVHSFGAIIRVNNDEVARRSFHDALRGDSPMKGHEEDFILLRVGTIDETTGAITALPAPEGREIIARGADWIAANNQKPELLK